ncbi:MAG: hypothetical protein Hals2KO_27380 [Halioglobus sp.]
MPFINYPLEPIVLRESLRARTTVVPVTVLSGVLVFATFAPFLVNEGADAPMVVYWLAPAMLLLFTRGLMSSYYLARLDEMSEARMRRADWEFRIQSIIMQATVGTGIWLIQSTQNNYPLIPLFVTMLIGIWALAALANLYSDSLTILLSLPPLLGQPALYWILQGGIGISLGIGLIMAMILMIILVQRGSQVFRESMLVRFEKDMLLRQVEEEQHKTQQALDQARAANEAKDFFMAAAGHDIKQPLYALSMLTDTLLMSNPPESTIPLLNNQKVSIEQLSEHFDALMDMGKFHDGSFKLSMSEINLGEFSSRIDTEIAPLCAEKNLHWRLDMGNVVVSTDPELMLRLLRNLLINAVRYTDHGEIRCTTRVEGDKVEVEVADTGSGIPDEHHDTVFDEFVRLGDDQASTTGAGLGLSIVRKIDSALDLNLKMESYAELGTRFTFRLPVVTANQ